MTKMTKKEKDELKIIRKKSHVYLGKIGKKYYVFHGNKSKGQVKSLGKDSPKDGQWFGNFNEKGIEYVASPLSYSGADYRWKRILGSWPYNFSKQELKKK